MKNTQTQKENAVNASEKKQDVKISKIQVIDARLLPKFGILMQTEY